MSNEFKVKMGAEAYEKLNELLKRQVNVMNVRGDKEVHKQAIRLMLKWIGSVYDMTIKPSKIEPDFDLDSLYKIREN